jgi:hypothetical protein
MPDADRGDLDPIRFGFRLVDRYFQEIARLGTEPVIGILPADRETALRNDASAAMFSLCSTLRALDDLLSGEESEFEDSTYVSRRPERSEHLGAIRYAANKGLHNLVGHIGTIATTPMLMPPYGLGPYGGGANRIVLCWADFSHTQPNSTRPGSDGMTGRDSYQQVLADEEIIGTLGPIMDWLAPFRPKVPESV